MEQGLGRRRDPRPAARRHRLLAATLLGLGLAWWLSRRELAHLKHVVGGDRGGESPSSIAPKVALLFLSRGPMPHEALWLAWLEEARGAVPAALAAEQCSRGPAGAAACAAAGELYAVHVHAPPGFSYPEGSFWGAKRTDVSVETRWGDPSLVSATRVLLAAAAADPSVQRFVLLSESDIPLYDPLTLHAQLMAEQRSRVNACRLGGGRDMARRWTPAMATPRLNDSHWRKSSQWFSLTRAHAAAVLADGEVWPAFERHCRYAEFDPGLGRPRDCVADEHYLPTLLAALGLEKEADCEGWGVAAMEWKGGAAHPRSFGPGDVSLELIQRLRGVTVEEAGKTVRSALEQYWLCEERAVCARGGDGGGGFQPLPGTSPLTARKFPGESAAAMLALARSCVDGRELLTGARCGGAAPKKGRRSTL